MPWSDGIKSIVEIVINSQIEEGGLGVGTDPLMLPTSEPAVSAPSPTHFPGATSSQVFPTVRRPPWPSSTGWISHTGNNLCWSTPSSLPLQAGWLVTSFFTFPGPWCTLSVLHTKDIFPRKPGEILDSFSFSSRVLGAVKTRSPLEMCDLAQNPGERGRGGSHHLNCPWPPCTWLLQNWGMSSIPMHTPCHLLSSQPSILKPKSLGTQHLKDQFFTCHCTPKPRLPKKRSGGEKEFLWRNLNSIIYFPYSDSNGSKYTRSFY